MSLHLVSFRPDFARLTALAARERLLPPGGDLGYALHAIFAASFGDLAPKPFRLFAPGEPGGGPAGRLLAYSSAPLDDLSSHAAAFADPAFANVLALPAAEDKAMPSLFAPGTRLGFSVRLRPVTRTGAARDGSVRAQERDVYQGPAADETGAAARLRIYMAWARERLGERGAATVTSLTPERLGRTGLFFRDRSTPDSRPRVVDGPDIVLKGEVTVADPEAFGTLLARGLGRFRAFGFGMLLLKPSGR